MTLLRRLATACLLWIGFVPGVLAAPPDLALPKGSGEASFRRFIEMAQAGRLGNDVRDANVGVLKNYVRVELLRPGAASKVLLLQPKSSTRAASRYFDIEAGEGATPGDVALVGKVLDEVFDADPFELAETFFYALPGHESIPSLREGWAADGSRGVLRVLMRRMSVLVSLEYTSTVIVGVVIAFVASLLLLWGSAARDS